MKPGFWWNWNPGELFGRPVPAGAVNQMASRERLYREAHARYLADPTTANERADREALHLAWLARVVLADAMVKAGKVPNRGIAFYEINGWISNYFRM